MQFSKTYDFNFAITCNMQNYSIMGERYDDIKCVFQGINKKIYITLQIYHKVYLILYLFNSTNKLLKKY